MKTISFLLIVVVTSVFVQWTSSPARAQSPYYTAQRPNSQEPAPYIGPFYPYPQVPLGWRETSLEWDDGWWFLAFNE
jgi:hypothetical protein